MTTARHDYLPAMGQRWLLFLYDPLTRLWGVPKVHEELLDRADVRPGQDVLDIGCGTGNLLIALAERASGVHLNGIDPDPAGLRRARRKARRAGAKIEFKQAYAGSLPFPDASLDRVLSSFMLHHLGEEETARAMGEIKRVLRPGGQLHIVDVSGVAKSGRRLARRHPHLVGDLPARVLGTLRAAGFSEVTENGRGSGRFGGHVFYRAVS
ncbi:class I SAM-dependent methyltransferase [Actinoplanes aureus]|uniref:Methyltransferase domain-containing protein n=1 Tax=Actinoplanes aureus TaxID=2792083 RepID=A0A931FZ58_9ACTN|nr:class I SAM-dependent methyltransferase [Actinoplanes aureus]MBG0564375.1 methyltransferase domain-containing protein [Actinoplanes aureus]